MIVLGLTAAFLFGPTALGLDKGPGNGGNDLPHDATTSMEVTVDAVGFWERCTAYDWTVNKTIENVEPITVCDDGHRAEAGVPRGESVSISYLIEADRSVACEEERKGVRGSVTVKNTGGNATENLTIVQHVQVRDPGCEQYRDLVVFRVDVSCHPILAPGEEYTYCYVLELNAVEGGEYRNTACVSITNHEGHAGIIHPVEGCSEFVLPCEPCVTEEDESATVTDVISCPEGFVCTPSEAGPWSFTGSGSVHFTACVENAAGACEQQARLSNKAVLTESDTCQTRESCATVDLFTGPCSHDTTLTVEKTAEVSWSKLVEYNWTVDKTAAIDGHETAEVVLPTGEKVMVRYTITADRQVVLVEQSIVMSGFVKVTNTGGYPTECMAIADTIEVQAGHSVYHQEFVISVASKPILGPVECYSYPYEVDITELVLNALSCNPGITPAVTNSAYVSIDNYVGHVDGTTIAATVPVVLPEPTVEQRDATATLTDLAILPDGFVADLFPGPWQLTGPTTITYCKNYTNVDADCGSTFCITDTVRLVESDSGSVRQDVAAVVVSTPVCPHDTSIEIDNEPGMSWSVTKRYDWSVESSASLADEAPRALLASGPAYVDLGPGDSASIDGAVTARYWLDGADMVIDVRGQVTVTNTGAHHTHGLAVTDRFVAAYGATVLADKSVSVDTSSKPVLAPGESHSYPYAYTVWINLTASELSELIGLEQFDNATLASFLGSIEFSNEAAVSITNFVGFPGVDHAVADTVAVSAPSPEVTPVDECADAVVEITCPAGFQCVVESGSTGPFHFAVPATADAGEQGAFLEGFVLRISYAGAEGETQYNLYLNVTLTECDSQTVSRGSATVVITTPVIGAQLQVEKSVASAWSRSVDHSWDIAKTAVPDALLLGQTGSGSVSYTITVTRTAVVGDIVTLHGTVTVLNAGNEATEGLLVTDTAYVKIGDAWVQLVSVDLTGQAVSLAPGESFAYQYSVTIDDELSAALGVPELPGDLSGYEFKNVANASVVNAYGSPAGQRNGAEASVPFSIATPDELTETDETATVEDAFEAPLGFSLDVSDAGPWTVTGSTEMDITVTVTNLDAACSSTFELVNSATLTTGDSGTVHTASASVTITTMRGALIEGYKFYDTNLNGAWDEDEPSIAGWHVYLIQGEILLSIAQTDQFGRYHFDCLVPGQYTVMEDDPAEWFATTPASKVVNIEPEGYANVTFGNAEYGRIEGYKFYDANLNGIWDEGEDAIAGWQVDLLVPGMATRTAITDADGRYVFMYLDPGAYTVSERQVASFFNTTERAVEVTVTPGGVVNVTFGNAEYASIHGYKFYDSNVNGIWDEGEMPIASWQIDMFGADGSSVTTFTDAEGRYSFDGLYPGVYTVVEAPVVGWFNTTAWFVEVTVPSGGVANVTFGNAEYVAVIGYKFNDENFDGAWDEGEAGVPNWRISLFNEQGLVATTTTDGDGYYAFTDLYPGAYTVSEEEHAGWVNTTPSSGVISLAPGEWTNLTFGNAMMNGILVTKFYDLNTNGVRDVGEAGLAGWTINVYDQAGGLLYTTATDASGSAAFVQILPGSYRVEEVLQGGWFNTTPDSQWVDIASGQSVVVEFGNAEYATIHGYKFNDANLNGVWDEGEPAIAGWLIDIAYPDGSSVTLVTDENGRYFVDGLFPGAYTVVETPMIGWFNTTEWFVRVVVLPGDAANVTFGNARYVVVEGYKFYDSNLNGAWDAGEAAVSNWQVTLYDAAMNVVGVTTTDQNGRYAFTDLYPGVYHVAEEQRAGWFNTTPAERQATLASGEVFNATFGNAQYGVVEGYKFYDANLNGIWDEGEQGISNWLIDVVDSEGNSVTVVTDAEGRYALDGLIPGRYTVVEMPGVNYFNTTAWTVDVVVASGATVNVTFGNAEYAAIYGYKFQDANANGLWDEGEAPIAGWQISLYDVAGLRAATTTDANGRYAFTELYPGAHRIVEEQRNGWFNTTPTERQVTLAPGQSSNVTFGNAQYAAIYGYKFYDANANGVWDEGEQGIAGWMIDLVDAKGNSITALTDGDGHYSFEGLLPGVYTVVEMPVIGWFNTTAWTVSVSILPGDRANVTFGNSEYATVFGYKFYDTNLNGAWDEGEAAIPGWTMSLVDGAGQLTTTTTDATGRYAFVDLYPGSYRITEALASNYFNTTPPSVDLDLLGGSVTNVTFGNAEYAAIHGYKFDDTNMNGVWDAGEAPVANWQIQLYDAQDNWVTFTLTDASGYFRFDQLYPGTYIVKEILEYYWLNVTPDSQAVLTAPGVSSYVEFGNVLTGDVLVGKFYDANLNGVWDYGEAGIEGWTINLYDQAGNLLASSTTDSTGFILFTYLPAGNYVLEEVLQGGWFNTTDIRQPVTAVAGAEVEMDFGNAEYGSIEGYKYFDSNANGVWDEGEQPIAGWLIDLAYPDGSSVTAVTDVDGHYVFVDLLPGVYTVVEMPVIGYFNTTAWSVSVTVSLGEAANVTFGNSQYSAVFGYKFHDANLNGVMDAGEGPIANWQVSLYDSARSLVTTIVTDENGHYAFVDLYPGTYVVAEGQRAGWFNTTPAELRLTLPGGDAVNVSFGNAQYGMIEGYKFYDANTNGAWDEGEAGIADWIISVFDAFGNTLITATDANGHYSFEGLVPGTYTVVEAPGVNFFNTTAWTVDVVITSGGSANVTFGNAEYATVFGYKFYDANTNGLWDAGEAPVAGWQVSLYDSAMDPVSTTSTDANGRYAFVELYSGTYTVAEERRAGWFSTTPVEQLVVLSTGQQANVTFGNAQYATVHGYKFYDLNLNGVWDDGETGVAGWLIDLVDSQGNSQTAATDESGHYSFDGLYPGTYTVVETPVIGWFNTTAWSVELAVSLGDRANATFGNAEYAAVHGYKFYDSNLNGIWDPEEAPVENWLISLYDGTGLLASALTDASGRYAFTDLYPGYYRVVEEQRSGWFNATPSEQAVTLAPGQSSNLSFGNTVNGVVQVSKFYDLNTNGVREAGEAGLAGWTFNLYDEAGNLLASATTDASGSVRFIGVPAGRYTVEEASQPGWFNTTQASLSIDIVAGLVVDVAFGNAECGSISGYKFYDTNANGVWDEGERAIPGWLIDIVYPDGSSITLVTDENGYYSVDGLLPGTYTVVELPAIGYFNTTTSTVEAAVLPGASVNATFGNAEYATVYGYKFYDLNTNGAWDAGESPIAGWAVSLYQGTTLVETTYTDADGYYAFTDLHPGAYRVAEGSVSNYFNTTASTVDLTLPSGAVGNVTFGNAEYACIGGYKFNDANMNGVWDSEETAIPNWNMYLHDSENNFLAYTWTDANGFYSFEQLLPGTYIVEEEFQYFWLNVTPLAQSATIVPGACANVTFGNVLTGDLYVGKFYDANVNGVWDYGEAGMEGWTINLYDGTGNLLATATTDATGYVLFTFLPSGNYGLEEVLQSGWFNTTPTRQAVTIVAGTEVRAEFGNAQYGSIEGFKFYDANLNGVWDAGEAPIEGWLVDLAYPDGSSMTAATDASGHYAFAGLSPGTYTVVEMPVVNYFPTTEWRVEVVLLPGMASNVTFGNAEFSVIHGYKFYDANVNGVWEAGEQAIAGWLIDLVDVNGSSITAVTDENGRYSFDGLYPGVYTVVEAPVVGWFNTTAWSVEASVAPGEVANVTFGNAEYAIIFGYKFYDANMNGAWDPEEAPIAGWGVTLYDTAMNALASATTNENGYYAFGELLPGIYTVSEEQRSGWFNTLPTDVQATLATGDALNATFANAEYGSVGGYKFYDTNLNGAWDDGELGIAGWLIDLIYPDGSSATTVTDEKGQFVFGQLLPGTYTVVELPAIGWFNTTAWSIEVAVTLGATANATFGNAEYAVVHGYKFHDANANGVWDEGEAPIAGWQIDLSDGDRVSLTTFTDENGHYVFDELLPGTYNVVEIPVFNYFPTTAYYQVVPLPPGGVANVTFGNAQYAVVVGYKFSDLNVNGVWDPEEPALANWQITLYDSAMNVVGTAATDQDGRYAFVDLVPGTYTVVEEQLTGWANTTPAERQATLNSGEVFNATFGNSQFGRIEGFKFYDSNLNGVWDEGEPGIADWVISTADLGGNTLIAVTDANGRYVFEGLAPGAYTVVESPVINFFPTTAWSVDTAVTLGATANVTFGNAEYATVDGYKYEDCNMNGVFDGAEVRLPGWTIELVDYLTGAVVSTAVTDVNGRFVFTDVMPGEYLVREVPQAGWIQVNEGDYYINAGPGTVWPVEFGNVRLGTIEVLKFNDLNTDGVMQGGEAPLEGFTFDLETVFGEYIATATTNASGRALFSNVVPGQYVVIEQDRAGWFNTNGVEQSVIIDCGVNGAVSFGNVEAGSIEGYKFNDANMNGVWDEGEAPIAGWLIQFSGSNGGHFFSDSTYTDANGRYAFTGLFPGAYTVEEAFGDGYFNTTSWYQDISVSPGASTNVTFGNAQYATIQGYKFYDSNLNGVWDDSEVGIAGWLIDLAYPDGSSATTMTDENGHYSFTGLAPGTYTVTEFPVINYFNTTEWSVDAVALPGDVVNVTFGNAEFAVIQGYKFYDANMNGLRDEGEPGIAGWLIDIVYPDGSSVTVETDADGHYAVDGLYPGVYTVVEMPRENFFNTTEWMIEVSLAPGAVANATFGNAEYAVVHGYKFYDANVNGVWDNGEAGLANWQIDMFDTDGISVTAFTDENGHYVFDGLYPGVYTIVEMPVIGYYNTTAWTVEVDAAPGTVNNISFGNAEYAVIHGYKFYDVNANGVWDDGEPAISGWLIDLAYPDGSSLSTVTDEKGHYVFGDLLPGTYTVVELPDINYFNTTAWSVEVVIVPGDVTNVSFGNAEFSVIHGYKFYDTNVNGVWDEGEMAMADWLIGVAYPDGSSVTVATDVNGHYAIDGLYPGAYTVVEMPGINYYNTTPWNVVVSVVPGSVNNVTFGNAEYATIYGYKFYDSNANGFWDDGEVGIADWIIDMVDPDGNSFTAVTDADGRYAFDGLRPGGYRVVETPVVNYFNTTDWFVELILMPGTAANVTFGNAEYSVVHGYKFFDANFNALWDDGEAAIGGWLIDLVYPDGSSTTAVTDENGHYVFDGLYPGAYIVVEMPGPNYVATTDYMVEVAVTSGSVTNVTFGNSQYAAIYGYKFNDANANGIWDAGELPISGWEINIYDANFDTVDYTWTDENGYYAFGDLLPGAYTIIENFGFYWHNVTPSSVDVTLSAGDIVNVTFANTPSGDLAVTVFEDLDSNGVLDFAELGLFDWTVNLYDGAGQLLTTTTTDSDGLVLFYNLIPGTYVIEVVPQTGWTNTSPISQTISVVANMETGVTFGFVAP